jgi:hypothetical protein
MLRHTTATMILKQGGEIRTVHEISGHYQIIKTQFIPILFLNVKRLYLMCCRINGEHLKGSEGFLLSIFCLIFSFIR